MIQSEGVMIDLDNFVSFPFKVLDSYSKELSNKYTKKYKNNKNNVLINAELNMIVKKIKEKLGSGITRTYN